MSTEYTAYLELIDPAANHRKHYFVAVYDSKNSPFYIVHTAWGRIGSKLSEKVVLVTSDLSSAIVEAHTIVREKQAKGYDVKTYDSSVNRMFKAPVWFTPSQVVVETLMPSVKAEKKAKAPVVLKRPGADWSF